MSDFLFVGTLLGLIIGLFHAGYLSRPVASEATSATRHSALSFALWTCGLWILMGAYVLGFWLIAVVLYVVFKAFR
jgi:hypothetical protein